jgi:hypothetical protein
MKKKSIDPKVYDLYDEYCHTLMNRRTFFNVASASTDYLLHRWTNQGTLCRI